MEDYMSLELLLLAIGGVIIIYGLRSKGQGRW